MAGEPNSRQNQILDQIEYVLGQVTTIESVGQGLIEHFRVNRPAVSVIPDMEETEDMTHDSGQYLEKLHVAVRILVDKTKDNTRTALGKIIRLAHIAILEDPTRDGLAMDTVKVGIKWLYLDEHVPRAGADLNLLVTYQTDAKDPTGLIA